MSALDLNKLVEALLLAKIKPRNDALNTLSRHSATKFRLNGKQFTVLTNALIKAIEIEREIYTHASTNAVVARASSASAILRELLLEALNKPPSDQPRYKQCISLVYNIISNYFLSGLGAARIFDPCAGDFAKIINKMLEEQFFVTHLTLDAWQKCYRFLVKAIGVELQSEDSARVLGRNLPQDLFEALYLVMGGNSHSMLVPLLQDKGYFPLLALLKSAAKLSSKRESPMLIVAFKIINKLLIDLSTEDITFMHQLISLGIKTIQQFALTSVNLLLHQFFIFLNLDTVHRFMSIENLPKLVGARDELASEGDVTSTAGFVPDIEQILYDLGMLIQSLLQRIQTQNKLATSDLELCHGQIEDWFHLTGIFLKSDQSLTWLAHSGISKFITLYYSLRHVYANHIESVALVGDGVRGSHKTPYKRQKLHDQSTKLWFCNTAVQFYNSMIAESDLRLQTLGLQLMMFNFEVSPHTFFTEKGDCITNTSNDSAVRILDLPGNDKSSTDCASALGYVVKSLGDKELTFWALACYHSLLLNMNPVLRLEEPIVTKAVHQLLRLLLSLVKDKVVSDMACRVFAFILLLQDEPIIQRLIDGDTLTQFGNIVDMSEIGGPAQVTDWSLQFWWALAGATAVLGSKKIFDISTNVTRWFLEKWDESLDLEGCARISSESFIHLLFWLSGQPVTINPRLIGDSKVNAHTDYTLDRDYISMKYGEQLQRFLALETISSVEPQTFKNVVQTIPGSNNQVEKLIDKIKSRSMESSKREEHIQYTIWWALFYSRIAIGIELTMPLVSASLNNRARELLLILPYTVKLRHNAAALMLTVLTALSPPESLTEIGFPFELINHHFQYMSANKIPLSESGQFGLDLESEFLTPEYQIEKFVPSMPVQSSASLKIDEQYAYFRFQVLYQAVNPDEHINFLRQIDSATCLLKCLNFYYLHSQLLSTALSPSSLSTAIRLIGESLLSAADTDRTEDTFAIAGKYLRLLLQLFNSPQMDDLRKDASELFIFLLQCLQKGLLLTEAHQLDVWKLAFEMLEVNDEQLIKNSEMTSLFLDSFTGFTNRMKYIISDALGGYLSNLDLSKQLVFYKEIFQSFSEPQESVEKSGTYAMFFALLTRGNSQLRLSALFNLLECTRWEFFLPFIRKSIELNADIGGEGSLKELFRKFRMELLKCWWIFEFEFLTFPFDLFGYEDNKSFMIENYRELVSISISINNNGSSDRSNRLLAHVAQVKQSDVQSLVRDCLSLVIPLAYTSDGVRNDVFKSLALLLKDGYKVLMREKLLLTILESLNLTDVKSETSLRTALRGREDNSLFSSTKILDIPLQSVISPTSSTDLCFALISKYWDQHNGEFWSLKAVYFLIRQLGVGTFLTNEMERQASLRRIKIVLSHCKVRINHFELARLLCEISLSFIDSLITGEIVSILARIDYACFLTVPSKQSLPPLLKILSEMATLEESKSVQTLQLVDEIEAAINLNDSFGKSGCILLNTISLIRKQQPAVTVQDVVAFLEESIDQDIIDHNSPTIFQLASMIFDSMPYSPSRTTSSKLAHLFTRTEVPDTLSPRFRLWISESLAAYFLSGKLHDQTDTIAEHLEFQEVDKLNFINDSNTLNLFVKLIIKELQYEDYGSAAFVETIVGALIWNFEASKNEVNQFLDFGQFYSSFVSYVAPIDFNSCMLIGSINYNSLLKLSSLEDFIVSMKDFVTVRTFEDWSSKLFMSLVHEISSFTSIAPLIGSCALKLAGITKKALPNFICFYISLSGSRGISKITRLMKNFHTYFRTYQCQQSIELITNIVITIRVGAKLEVELLMELYSTFDHKEIFLMVKDSNMPKSALLIFEDAINEKNDPIDWKTNRQNLTSIYVMLDDKDLLYGITDGTLENSLYLIEQFASPVEKVRLDSAFLDSAFLLGESIKTTNMKQSVMQDGQIGVSKFLNGASDDSESLEWAWKLNQWDIPAKKDSYQDNDVIYSYFKQIKDLPSASADVYYSTMLRLVSQSHRELRDPTSRHEFYAKVTQWFETLGVISSANSVFLKEAESLNEESQTFDDLTKWFERSEPHLYDNVLHARRTAFHIYGTSVLAHKKGQFTSSAFAEATDLCSQGEVKEIIRYSDHSRQNEELQKMVNSTILLEKFVSKLECSKKEQHENLKKLSLFQAARTFWSQGKANISVAMLNELSCHGDIKLDFKRLCVSNVLTKALIACWKADSRLDLGSNILITLVDPMVHDIDSVADIKQRAEIYHLLARFCESQHKSKNLKEQIQELDFRVQSRRIEIEEIKSHYGKISVPSSEKKAVQKYYNRLKNQVSSESSQVNNLKELRSIFASNALKFYLNALLLDDALDEDLDRFFSLFLELSGDDELQASIKDKLQMLPSDRALAWCTQLLSRLSNTTSNFQESVQGLVTRMFLDHPYHSLYYLFSLIYHKQIAEETNNMEMISRVSAACGIKDRLKSSDQAYSADFLLPIEKLCDESIKLAEAKSTRGKPLHLDKLKIGSYWISHLPRLPPPTMRLRVSKTGYRDVPMMESIEPKVSIASSGLSLPKIATFALSNGEVHKTLFKHGTDDLRQDAIMEEVFEKVNKIFVTDRETRKRQLRVRTYRAVPLGPKAGVIEFVPNSIALIDVVRPYHQKLDSMKSEKARELMKESQTSEVGQRVAVYQKIVQKVHPVLHLFFMSNFVTPDTWYRSRNMFTKGVATTSMVGHVLGLGDRHCNNILLDKFTGEPIHIDLGVAFDQGKRLPIPETVPFRLTRDIVDGLGFTGTQGAFSKLCEHTFRVLRGNQDHILAILDVLRWDPLYSWSISPIRKMKVQEGNTAMRNLEPQEDGSEAGTALLAVSEKLNAGGLSVEATVRELIREATSEQNLAVIYCGWCPFY